MLNVVKFWTENQLLNIMAFNLLTHLYCKVLMLKVVKLVVAPFE
jgi:hypothetical protein